VQPTLLMSSFHIAILHHIAASIWFTIPSGSASL
jgi:hypothetical protein